jgi:hypothetical protein
MNPEMREIVIMALFYIGIPMIFFIGVFLGKTITEWWLRK